jgi:hypothetical protein
MESLSKKPMKSSRRTTLLPYVIAAIALIAAKMALIAHYGNPTPWGDQWTAEGLSIFRPWLLGELRLEKLFSGYNEHRIFTSRVLSLLLFELDGRIWNPILQMQVNAVLHVLALGVFVVFSTRALCYRSTLLLLVFTLALNAYPFGFANTLFGFQSCVYLLLLFGFIFLWCMSAYDSYSPAWWVGLVAGGLCVLSFASGAVAIVAGLLILVFRRIMDQQASGVSNSSIVLVGAGAVMAILQTPTFTPDIPLKASDVSSFLHALLRLLSWPVEPESGGISPGVLIIYLPLTLFALAVFRNPVFRTSSHYYVLAVGAWVIGQILLMAYGRGSFYYLTSRYLDIYAVGLLAGFVALLALADSWRIRWLKPVSVLIWVSTVVYGFWGNWSTVRWQLDRLSREAQVQEVNVRNYLLSGDKSYLVGKPKGDIPLHDAQLLIKLLDDPRMRVFLPRNIYVPGTAYDEARHGAGGGANR